MLARRFSQCSSATGLVALCLTGPLQANEWHDTIRGGLMGAAAGAIVAELDDDLDRGRLIPVFSAIGALSGYAWNRANSGRPAREDYDAFSNQPYPPYSYGPVRQRIVRTSRPNQIPVSPQSNSPQNTTSLATQSNHPNIQLVPMSLMLPNGNALIINVLKTPAGYIGPKGKRYTQQPTSAAILSEISAADSSSSHLPKPTTAQD